MEKTILCNFQNWFKFGRKPTMQPKGGNGGTTQHGPTEGVHSSSVPTGAAATGGSHQPASTVQPSDGNGMGGDAVATGSQQHSAGTPTRAPGLLGPQQSAVDLVGQMGSKQTKMEFQWHSDDLQKS